LEVVSEKPWGDPEDNSQFHRISLTKCSWR
jgi:hypothetical protein